MTGINWEYNDSSKTRIYWSFSNDNYLYLGQLLINFEFEFNKSLEAYSSEFELTKEQVIFLIDGIESRLDKLIKRFNPDVPNGLTSISKKYKGKKYELYVKMSRNHLLINTLIEFHKFLKDSITTNKSVVFRSGEYE